jgi:23S rRNA (adenine2030-N6)-methyltransferase
MLSYQHIYHAGNFADVHKHAVFVRLLKAQKAKPGAFEVIDTHAGRGLYDLAAAEAQFNKEYDNGIGAVLHDQGHLLADYLAVVRKFNPGGELRKYPGSAMIARELMRPADKLTCTELHPAEFAALQKSFAGIANTELAMRDGFKCLVDAVPPPSRRGVVFVDPSFEIKTEYADLARQLQSAWKKWPTGIFMAWYPLLLAGSHRRFLAALRETTVKDVIVSELSLREPPQEEFRMYGSGVAIINPPWREGVLTELTQYIASKMPLKAISEVFWLDNMKINPENGQLEA